MKEGIDLKQMDREKCAVCVHFATLSGDKFSWCNKYMRNTEHIYGCSPKDKR